MRFTASFFNFIRINFGLHTCYYIIKDSIPEPRSHVGNRFHLVEKLNGIYFESNLKLSSLSSPMGGTEVNGRRE